MGEPGACLGIVEIWDQWHAVALPVAEQVPLAG